MSVINVFLFDLQLCNNVFLLIVKSFFATYIRTIDGRLFCKIFNIKLDVILRFKSICVDFVLS